MTIGEFLKKKRKESGLTTRALSALSGVSDSHIVLIEQGKRRPTFEALAKIINALKVPWDVFLRETGHLPSETEPDEGEKG